MIVFNIRCSGYIPSAQAFMLMQLCGNNSQKLADHHTAVLVSRHDWSKLIHADMIEKPPWLNQKKRHSKDSRQPRLPNNAMLLLQPQIFFQGFLSTQNPHNLRRQNASGPPQFAIPATTWRRKQEGGNTEKLSTAIDLPTTFKKHQPMEKEERKQLRMSIATPLRGNPKQKRHS